MNEEQKKQFNQMRTALIRIHNEYLSSDELRETHENLGLDYEEALEMAYDNIQTDAFNSVNGINPMK